jgi:hypothetical protein
MLHSSGASSTAEEHKRNIIMSRIMLKDSYPPHYNVRIMHAAPPLASGEWGGECEEGGIDVNNLVKMFTIMNRIMAHYMSAYMEH